MMLPPSCFTVGVIFLWRGGTWFEAWTGLYRVPISHTFANKYFGMWINRRNIGACVRVTSSPQMRALAQRRHVTWVASVNFAVNPLLRLPQHEMAWPAWRKTTCTQVKAETELETILEVHKVRIKKKYIQATSIFSARVFACKSNILLPHCQGWAQKTWTCSHFCTWTWIDVVNYYSSYVCRQVLHYFLVFLLFSLHLCI